MWAAGLKVLRDCLAKGSPEGLGCFGARGLRFGVQRGLFRPLGAIWLFLCLRGGYDVAIPTSRFSFPKSGREP